MFYESKATVKEHYFEYELDPKATFKHKAGNKGVQLLTKIDSKSIKNTNFG